MTAEHDNRTISAGKRRRPGATDAAGFTATRQVPVSRAAPPRRATKQFSQENTFRFAKISQSSDQEATTFDHRARNP